MPELLKTGLAILAVALILTALVLMTGERLMTAGLCFLGASVVIYLRETYAKGNGRDSTDE